MAVGYIILLGIAALIYLGVGQRVLDRMRLSDKVALGFIIAMILGTFINIPIKGGTSPLSINLGGILPVFLAFYVLSKASGKEVMRALLGIVVTTAIILAISKSFTFEEGKTPLDPTYLWSITAAIVAYAIGRSRRAAFISAVLSINLVDIINFAFIFSQGAGGTTALGGAGILDASLIAGFLAVGIVELVGETRERLHGGPDAEKRKDEKMINVDNVEYAGALLDFEQNQKKKEDEESKKRGELNE